MSATLYSDASPPTTQVLAAKGNQVGAKQPAAPGMLYQKGHKGGQKRGQGSGKGKGQRKHAKHS